MFFANTYALVYLSKGQNSEEYPVCAEFKFVVFNGTFSI